MCPVAKQSQMLFVWAKKGCFPTTGTIYLHHQTSDKHPFIRYTNTVKINQACKYVCIYIYIFRLQCRVCSLIQTQMPWHHELDWRRRNPCRSTIDILAAFSVCTGHPETTSAHINTPKKALMVDHCAWNLVLGAEFKSTLLDVLLRAIWICLTWVKCGNKHRSLQV